MWLLPALLILQVFCKVFASEIKIEKPLTLNLTELSKLKDESSSPILLHLYNGTSCTGECEEDLKVLNSIAKQLGDADPLLRIVSSKAAEDVVAESEVGAIENSAIFAYIKGFPLRLDSHGLEEENERSLANDLKSFFMKQLPEIKTVDEWKTLAQNKSLIFLYYGLPTDEAFVEVEVACRLSNIVIHWTSNSDIADLLNLPYPENLYTYIGELKKAFRMRRYPKLARVNKFLESSSRPVPMPFKFEIISNSIQGNYPALIMHAANKESLDLILKCVDENEELLRNYFHVYLVQDLEDQAAQISLQQCTRSDRPLQNFTICIMRQRKGIINKYVYSEELNEDEFTSFLHKYITHQLPIYFKNEKLNATHIENTKVQLLNTKRTEKFFTPVNDDDVLPRLLYISLDDCEECDKFDSIFNAASSEASFSHMVFGRINANRNELVLPENIDLPAVLAYQVTDEEEPNMFVINNETNQESFGRFLAEVDKEYKTILREIEVEKIQEEQKEAEKKRPESEEIRKEGDGIVEEKKTGSPVLIVESVEEDL